MVPSRGLRPAHIASFHSRQSLCLRSPFPRQFSSVPQASTQSAARQRTQALRPAAWRIGASASCNATTTATTTSIRHGSWYAPWTWGGSSQPAADANPTLTPSEFAADTPSNVASDAVVTTATPELAPAGIDKTAVMDGTAAAQPTHASVESLVDEVVRNPDALVAPLSTYSGDPTAAIDRIGALKDMGLDFGWGPTATFEWLIEHVYLMSSMGWGGSIVVSTIVLRAGMFYFQRQGSNNMAKMAALQPLTKDYQAKMKEAITANDTEKVDFYKYRMAAIYKEAKINPITGMIPMVWQLIFGFGAWRCIRNMSALPVPGIDQGGWLWFQNLAVADPYYLVPAIGGGLMYLTMRLGGETGTADQTMARGTATALQVGMPIMMVVVMANQPAGVALYVLVSSTTSMFTATLLRNPNFRASTGMTPLPSRAAQEVWTKVARGEINLHDVVDDKGNIIYKPQPAYQAPTRVTPKSPKKPKTLTVAAKPSEPLSSSSAAPASAPLQHRGLNIKNNTTALPSHLDAKPKRQKVAPIDPATRDRDDDFEYGLPSGIGKKIDWFGRNYSPTYMFRRLRNWATSQTDEARKQREAKKKAEAKSRFGGGR